MTGINCPQCGRGHAAAKGFCQCGYPLYVDDVTIRDPTASHNPAVLPGQAENPPAPTPPPAPAATPDPTMHQPATQIVFCANGHRNEQPDGRPRTLCGTCGIRLEGPAPAPMAPIPPPPPLPGPANPGPLIAAGVVAAALIIGGLAWFVLRSSDDDGGADPAPAEQAVDRAVGPVPSSAVVASASSVLPDSGDLTYGAANTIDGNRDTAWNNHSAVAGAGVGETLTYTFDQPVDLSRIEIINGYVRDERVFTANSSIATVEIVTDGLTLAVDLQDIEVAQTIEQPFGVTGSVVLRVLAIHPGAGFGTSNLTADLAVTEVQFFQFVD